MNEAKMDWLADEVEMLEEEVRHHEHMAKRKRKQLDAAIQLFYAPCKNYDGKALVRKVGMDTDTRGQAMVVVEAVNGEPWSDWTSGGYAMTARAKFYPEHVTPANENAPIAVSALSTFSADQLAQFILTECGSAR